MATIYREFIVDVPLDFAWEAVRAFGDVHIKLARDFVTNTTSDGDLRTLTFANGLTATEKLVTLDDKLHLLVYSALNDNVRHHNAAMHLRTHGRQQCHIRWTTDILPAELAPSLAAMKDEAIAAVKTTLLNRYQQQ